MSFIFATVSRRRAGTPLRCLIAFATLLLAGNLAKSQTNTSAPPPLSTNTAAIDTNSPAVASDSTNTTPSFSRTNDLTLIPLNDPDPTHDYQARLEEARHLRLMRQTAVAEPVLEDLLTQSGAPEKVKGDAMFELALNAHDDGDTVRAQQIYAQFISRFPDDPRVPEVYLRQGQLFRQMGLNSLALTKFYSVMTTALALKNDRLDYYQKLVLDAQMEIAETHYQSGQFAEAADFFSRLLKQNNPSLNREEIQFRLIRSLQSAGNYNETAAQAHDFLERFPDSPNQPEVRFCLALALKQLGQKNESLQQVLALLREEKTQAKDHPDVWAYWQQRTGNEIANQLYCDGDYPKALDIYLSLNQLDHACTWQFPVTYQIGMTYERLLQPQMAMQSYSNILSREAELGTNASPGLKAIVDMARWRINFIQWQTRAENVNDALKDIPAAKSASSSDPLSSKTAIP